MENKNSKETQQTNEAKALDSRKRDRGDNFKRQDGLKNKVNEKNNFKAKKPIISDRGDTTVNKVTTTHKVAINDNKTGKDKVIEKSKQPNDRQMLVTNVLTEVITEVEKSNIKPASNLAHRKKVEDRKTEDKVKLKVTNNQNIAKVVKNAVKSDFRNDQSRVQNQANLKSGSKEIIVSNKDVTKDINEDASKKDKETAPAKKPLIKTVKSKNDNKIYKAVTFTEKTMTKPTTLEINIPNIQTKKTKIKLVDKNLEAKLPTQISNVKSTSKLSCIEKERTQNRRNRISERTKRKRLNRCISSPEKFKKVESPPTEVAKWGPCCLNAHTKPYYEAWVNTTLAAINKISKKDKLYLEKQNIIKAFQKSLEYSGVESPDLIHEDYSNEFYTGKIKIKHRNASKMKRQPLITPLLD